MGNLSIAAVVANGRGARHLVIYPILPRTPRELAVSPFGPYADKIKTLYDTYIKQYVKATGSPGSGESGGQGT